MKYRIITDRYSGYGVERRRFRFAPWINICGTWSTLKDAEQAIERHKGKGKIVKFVN